MDTAKMDISKITNTIFRTMTVLGALFTIATASPGCFMSDYKLDRYGGAKTSSFSQGKYTLNDGTVCECSTKLYSSDPCAGVCDEYKRTIQAFSRKPMH